MNALDQKTDTAKKLSVDPDWWRGAVVYQIYPRSFQDSNGDGIGDLRGIINRLPYVASLGVDAIWISPFSKSPMKDFGYDVSDYRDVDPMFGTLGDFDDLIATAHDLGIRVIIDLVISHSSDQHEWFKESRQDRENPRADWYVWSDPKEDGTPPNNWLSIFGGPAWTWEPRREQYYLHNFLKSQPDLNFHNPDVQDALLDVTRFWLKRGADGFRLDTINFYFADAQLRDNPALPMEARNNDIAPGVNPYNHQDHIHSKNQPENLEFLKRFRAVLDEFPGSTALGEVGDSHRGLELMGEYTAGDERVHMCYAFDFLNAVPITAERVVSVLSRINELAADGWPCWAFSNHDVIRHTTRWNLSETAQRGLVTLMMCMRGSVCLYQGEELGLQEADVDFEDLQDPYGIEFWPEFKGRDGCRTPMPWENSNQYGGFSDARPWLPMTASHVTNAVAEQEKQADALLHFYRRAVAMRRGVETLQKGTIEGLTSTGTIVHFTRSFGDDVVFCAVNMGDTPAIMPRPDGEWTQLDAELGGAVIPAEGSMHLEPWQSAIARKA